MNRLSKSHIVSLLFTGAFLFIVGSTTHQVHQKSAGAPIGYTGAPGEATCNTAGCHDNYALNSGNGNLEIEVETDSVFQPDYTHQFNIQITQKTTDKFGFQAVLLRGDTAISAGELKLTDGLRTQIITPDDTNSFYYGRYYITHTIDGNEAVSPDTNRWEFNWEAPTDTVDSVTIYVAAVGANGNEVETQDTVYSTSRTLYRDTTAISSSSSTTSSEKPTLYPNPIQQTGIISLNRSYEKIYLQIYSVSGQQVEQRAFRDVSQVSIQSEWFPNGGTYIYRLKLSNQQVKTGQFVVYE